MFVLCAQPQSPALCDKTEGNTLGWKPRYCLWQLCRACRGHLINSLPFSVLPALTFEVGAPSYCRWRNRGTFPGSYH